jgi:hypothetical protein
MEYPFVTETDSRIANLFHRHNWRSQYAKRCATYALYFIRGLSPSLSRNSVSFEISRPFLTGFHCRKVVYVRYAT